MQLVGVDPVSYRSGRAAAGAAEPDADLRILLCHFPQSSTGCHRAPSTSSLAGHLHDGQIACPTGAARCASHTARRRTTKGSTGAADGSARLTGLGTTFVPFRFFARPEATELVLDSACGGSRVDLGGGPSRYAADAALEVDGVRGLVERALPGTGAAVVVGDDGRVTVELHLAVGVGRAFGRSARRCSRASPSNCAGWRTSSRAGRRRRRRGRPAA